MLVGQDTFSPVAAAPFTTFSALSLTGLAIATLEIVPVSFDAPEPTGGGWTVNADNIVLDSGATVPLPAPLALVAPGLLGLLILRRRRAA